MAHDTTAIARRLVAEVLAEATALGHRPGLPSDAAIWRSTPTDSMGRPGHRLQAAITAACQAEFVRQGGPAAQTAFDGRRRTRSDFDRLAKESTPGVIRALGAAGHFVAGDTVSPIYTTEGRCIGVTRRRPGARDIDLWVS